MAASHRYKRIVADPEKIDTMLAGLFMDVTGEEPENIVLDLDATDDAIHGKQERSSSRPCSLTAPLRP